MQHIAEDMINHPSHYADYCSIECIDAMEIAFGKDDLITFCLCNAFKYIWRHQYKNGYEDLDKANWYLNKACRLIGCPDNYYTDKINTMRSLIDKFRKNNLAEEDNLK